MNNIFRKSRLIKVSIILLLFLVVFISPVKSQDDDVESDPVIQELNEKIESKKQRIESLEEKSDEYLEKINAEREKGTSLRSELSIVDNLIAKVQLDVQANQILIDQNNLEIESLKYLIAKEEEKIGNYKDRLREYIRLINKADQKSYLEILILNNSVSEFFIQTGYIEELQSEVQASLNRIKLMKSALETNQADVELKKQSLEELQAKLVENEAKLESDMRSKENLIIQSKNSELQFQKFVAESKAEQNEIEVEILSLQGDIEDKVAELERRRKLQGTPTIDNSMLSWPVDPSRGITAYFHDPEYPYRYLFEHSGIDLRAYQGTEIAAPADGYVARAKDAGYGYSYIILIHDNTISTVYGHVSKIYVKSDQYVTRGQIIGLTGGMPGTLGAGPYSTGPHLHFEVRANGIPVNPLEYLQ